MSCVLSGAEGDDLVFYALSPLQGKGEEMARTKLGTVTGLVWRDSPDGSHIALNAINSTGKFVSLICEVARSATFSFYRGGFSGH